MTRKALLTAIVAAALGVSSQLAFAFPAAPLNVAPQSGAEKVTFWGRAFPYQYDWSLARACTRYETVETPRGPVTRRIWVCRVGRSGAVVSYRN